MEKAQASGYPFSKNLPAQLFRDNRQRFFSLIKEANLPPNSVGLIKGCSEVNMYDGDVIYPFYQESNFYYLTGVNEPDSYAALDFDKQQLNLFIPKYDNIYKVWMTVKTPDDLLKDVFVNCDDVKVHYMTDLGQVLKSLNPSTIYLSNGVNSDSGLKFSPVESKHYEHLGVKIDDSSLLYETLSNSRVIKTPLEIEAMRWASRISSEAHCEVMKQCRPGLRESHLEVIFNNYGRMNYFTGKVQPYQPICGCHHQAATLHYPDNDKILEDGKTMLTDQGISCHHYAADITTCYPVNGKFTQKQKDIYDVVLRSNRKIFELAKPGVSWVDMHKEAEKETLRGLKELGLVDGDVEEMAEKRVGFIFQPHGLGHLLGLDVHDAGGYTSQAPKRETLPGLKSLRTARILEKDMLITIEPGCYFRDFLINGEFGEDFDIPLHYLNKEKIREYQEEINGVRIEDVVLITETGCENLSAGVPRTTEEIEKCMRGEKWN